jgi:hypothetical protein
MNMPEPISPVISPSKIVSQPSSNSVQSSSQTDRVCLILDGRRLALAGGEMLGQPRQVFWHRLVAEPEFAEQRPVADEVRIAADRHSTIGQSRCLCCSGGRAGSARTAVFRTLVRPAAIA